MTHRPYPQMKPSGVEWFTTLPEAWQPMRLKYLLRKRITDGPHTTPTFVDDGVPFLSVDGIQDGELVFEGCRFISKEDHAAYITKALPEADDILLGKAASTGKVARVKVNFEFSIWSPLALIKPDRSKVDPSFLEYALKSHSSQAQVDVLCTSNTQKNISMDDIPSIVFALPTLSEQQAIAAYLDRKTAEIDTVIRLKERQLELLAEKRQALISQAVTRGLDPTVPLKPSGVEWLGDVPEHWEIVKLKHLASIRYGLGQPPNQMENGVPLLRATNVQRGKIVKEGLMFIDPMDVPYDRDPVLRANDIIVVRSGAYTGDSAIVPPAFDGAITGYDMVVRVKQANPFFVAYGFLSTPILNNQIHLLRMRAAQPHLNAEELGDTLFFLPPFEEQRAIVAYLDRETARMEEMAGAMRGQIERLREYRQAVISAAVTGKIDVRDSGA